MTPDSVHYILLVSNWIALPCLVLAVLILHRRLRSRWSLTLLVGLIVILSGQVLQQFSPLGDLGYEEFRGIVVSSGAFPFQWYAGSLVSAFGLLTAAAGALGLALSVPPARPLR